MPYTVTYSFDQFRQNIEPKSYDRDVATRRKRHLVQLLEGEFDIVESFATGSLPRFTSVKNHADLDIMVALHYGKHIKGKDPSQVLTNVRTCLGEQYTDLRRNGQAVTLFYKTWPNVDVVPVARVATDGIVTSYSVPNMEDESWISSQPKRHSKEMTERNQSFGREFKRIIKMIKWWNHQHSSYLQSYHIEVMALKTLNGVFDSYPWNTYRFFDEAVGLAGSLLWHNIGYVDTYLTYNQRQEAVIRLTTARDKSRSAWHLTYGDNDDDEGAIKIWKQIFGSEFPNYG